MVDYDKSDLPLERRGGRGGHLLLMLQGEMSENTNIGGCVISVSSPRVSSRIKGPFESIFSSCGSVLGSSLGPEIRERGRRPLGAISINLSHTWLHLPGGEEGAEGGGLGALVTSLFSVPVLVTLTQATGNTFLLDFNVSDTGHIRFHTSVSQVCVSSA